MQITKKEFIQKLYEIEERENLKLGKEVQRVIRNEIIPLDVIKLVNRYDKDFLQIYSTYNVIYESRNKNPLYRNLRNKNLKIEEKAVALSSLITKILISCTNISDINERQLFVKAMGVQEINNAITEYVLNNNSTSLIECYNQVSELLHILYSN